MIDLAFVLVLMLAMGAALGWGVRSLPGARWQFLASVPRSQGGDGHWEGVNFTWYGVLSASAYALAVSLFLILTAACGIPLWRSALTASVVLGVAVPASKLVARWVEGQDGGFSVGGSVFVTFLIAPGLLALSDHWLPGPAVMGTLLAALSVAYCFGEGLGRLACLSFGCCYGRDLSKVSPRLRTWLCRPRVVFEGSTKKACYASGLQGKAVVPVQALSLGVLGGLGLVSLALFLQGQTTAAFLVSAIGSQLWRVLSEFLRADWRGGRRFSTYQTMASLLALVALGLGLMGLVPSGPAADLSHGLAACWRVEPVLGVQALWWIVFLFMGRSRVTGARLQLFVHHGKDVAPDGAGILAAEKVS